MGYGRALLWFYGLFLVLAIDGGSVMGLSRCKFPAIYNFGDSNSDTGGISAAFLPVPPPNGETFFHKPSGRVCDGRLLIDFIAESLGLPSLSAYLDSIGTNFQHGANFATGGSTIQPQNLSLFTGGFSPFSLNVQLWQFSQFKMRTNELYQQGNTSIKCNLPKPEDFSKALYTLDIGQNDLAAGFQSMTNDQVLATIPNILDQFSQAIQQLYQLGARAFWIHNTGPIGCLPYSVIYYPLKPRNLDQNGCVKPQNEVAQEFNRQLKDRVSQLRGILPQAALTYVDVYSAKYGLITNAKKQGFVEPLKFCCGHHEDGGYHVDCGKKAVVNGTEVYGASCGNPSMYVSWDGVHYSHAANHWIANRILNGALSDPHLVITHACHRSPR
ncbi:GDSL esterase/lipase At5g14450 [Magnolia sinica]|uniref:GDSL esterase/lipase At5g14450 n=1 Tax=Magnolia sinica TaxID=86752 RepID=UPI00265B4C0A|nr:GDSL esterase/lipase At5g14450 [Magnolia sinica]